MKLEIVSICLDGMPFLPLHLPEFEKLTIPWCWSVVHGAAANTGSTRWCQPQIPRLSRDGGSEYINGLLKHPNIQIFQRQWWPGGKDEMFRTAIDKITEPCILFMPDIDEIWRADQIERIVQMFEERPDAMRALFDCRYWIGKNIITTGNNCWSHRQGEWLRAFRLIPGMVLSSHEPPILAGNKGTAITQEETSKLGLVFDHFAYVLESQVRFKQHFYGLKNAVEQWQRLQANTEWPVHDLKQFLPWVGNGVTADLFSNVYPGEINPTSKLP